MLTLMMLKSCMLLNIGPPLQKILHTQVVGEATCQCFGWKRPVWIDMVLDATRHQLTPRPEVTEHGDIDRLMMSASPFGRTHLGSNNNLIHASMVNKFPVRFNCLFVRP